MRFFRKRNLLAHRLSYFVYVSDAKLDMLYEQIPRPLRKRLAAEVKVDFKMVGVTIKGAEDKGPLRLAKLAVVERFVQDHEDVGTVHQPATYFRGTMDMRWATLNESIVLFHGRHDGDIVALGGSLWHLVGGQRPTDQLQSLSFSPDLWVGLVEHISADPDGAEEVRRERANSSVGANEQDYWENWKPAVHAPPEAALGELESIYLTGPLQRVEFLARRLVDEQFFARDRYGVQLPPGRVTLGTPLYVALAV